MYKKMLSAAAAAAIVTTSGFAFDATSSGYIVTQAGQAGKYTTAFNAEENLTVSANQKGDAIVFPAFNQTDGWSTEMVVRNTSNEAVIAKIVAYAADDSRELRDFNIYLSANDVFRFTIADGKISTSDASIPKQVSWPTDALADNNTSTWQAADAKNLVMNVSGENLDIATLTEDKGYVIVYGMAESNTSIPAGQTVKDGYHLKHDKLFLDYRALLDDCRDGWRNAFSYDATSGNLNMNDGLITGAAVAAPNVKVANGCGVDFNQTTAANEYVNTFTSVNGDALSGTVTIKTNSDDGVNARDMILPATALENFTSANQMVLWTEGEYAAIADRRIVPTGSTVDTLKVKYSGTDISNDANAFKISTAFYTFTAKDDTNTAATNTLVITQPMKRILQDLGNTDQYWTNKADGCGATNYGGFQTINQLFDEEERGDTVAAAVTTPVTIVSPFNDSKEIVEGEYNCDELQTISDIETHAQTNEDFQNQTTNGFAKVTFTNGTVSNGISAIVTQMTGSMVNGQPKINWIYTPIVK